MDSVNSRVFALIIAIDKYAYNETWSLKECVNDANLIESFITTTFTTHSIRRLENEAATRQDILDNFQSHLIENTNVNPGDTILFYFAGHGSRVTAPVGWESNDGLIETICPHDQRDEAAQGAPGIPDVTIAALLRELARNKGDNITVILDSCYSGGVTRAPGESLKRSLPPDHLPFPDIDRDIWTRDGSNFDSTKKARGFGGVDCQYVLLAACGELQTASDGYFTSSLVKSLRQKPSTYADLLSMVPPKRNRSGIAVQHPQCEWNKNRLLFTTLIALDNKAFRLTKRDDGRYTVAAWAIHGVQIGMFFRVHSPPAVLRIEDIFASSCILVVQDPSTDIPSGAAAFAMMNLGMKVFLEPSDILPPDLSLIDSCFTIVSLRQDADLILSLESSASGENLRIESADPLLRSLSCHVTHLDWNEVRDHLPRSLDAIAHFRYHLGRRSDPGGPFTASGMSTHVADRIFSDSESEISLFRLGPAIFFGFREPEQPERNLLSLSDRTLTLRNQNGVKYGIRLQSKPLQSHLFFYVFYMDPSDFSIQALHLPKPPPNPACETVHIGYGAGGGYPIEFDLEGKNYDAGFLKVFISTEYADMSSLVQESAAAQRVAKRSPDVTGLWGAWLGAITVSDGGEQ
ncbi:caspase domain-containing protein [Mycena vulgaris]|nr:caspase domain-containing protein [Mycena vulgaris]